jgi:cell division protein FtsQ
VDSGGVIFDRPVEGEFRFPVVSGISESMPLDQRQQRMNAYIAFLKEIEATQPGADDHISEVDLSDASDIRATITGLGSDSGGASTILVHFGDSDFGNRYHLLADNIDQWRSSAGSVDSVDLRFARQVVVNPESKTLAAKASQSAPGRAKPVPKQQ